MKEGHFDKTQAIVRLKPVEKPVATFKEFLLRDKKRIWRMWIYRRMFTPYEQEQKFQDEYIYENGDLCNYICIETVHDLPDGDLVLGVHIVYDKESYLEDKTDKTIAYYKFSEIRLAYYPEDKINIFEEGL